MPTVKVVFLAGPIPYIWSGVEDDIGGINARWYNTDDAIRTEAFAQTSKRLKVTTFELMTRAGNLAFSYSEEEWV